MQRHCLSSASLALGLILLVGGCRPEGGGFNIPEPGIPLALAEERGRRIQDLRYELSFDIPNAVEDPISGRVTARFDLRDASVPLVFDFDPLAANRISGEAFVESVIVGESDSDFQLANGHIVIPVTELDTGENTVEIVFRAGEGALTRNPEFLYTLFVPALAHTVFPSFDQPDLKARYSLELTIPQGWQALANGAEVAREETGDRVLIRYDETEAIPTYLFAFAAGLFQVEEAERDGRTFRMFHRETDTAKLERNRDPVFDLHAAALEQLEDYTGIPYPFGKFDFALIPAFQFGGMEHPGAIFYRDSGILLEETATEQQRLSRASLISHETSHMWFGDLVTMRWFNDVWMKEVFANFMAAKIVNPSFPEVNHDLLFLTNNYPVAYGVDRTAGTHPIRQELDNLNEAGSLYGAIIYQKAPIVMRQLERIVGPDRFREGMRVYLDRFRFSNATWLDLIEILDERTETDLVAWSRAWVEESGRPVIRTEIETGGEGTIIGFTLVQSDPTVGRSLQWTQQIDVLIGTPESSETISVELAGERVDVGLTTRTDFVLPSGSGMAYGDIVLDEGSRVYLLARLGEFDDAVTRGAVWVTLWEEMLGGRILPQALMGLALDVLAEENTEQVVQLLLNGVDSLFWRYLSALEMEAVAPRLERVLRDGIGRSESSGLKSAYFSAFYSVVTQADGVDFLDRVWSREETIEGLPLSETDETTMAEELALRSHPQASEILAQQLNRIENPDRRERFQFVISALSTDPEERAAFFTRIGDPSNRGREPWVLGGLSFLNHPLRAGESVEQIRPALEELLEVRDTGDIFFPRAWLSALLSGHNSLRVAAIIREFLAEQEEDYPPRLRQIILQAADPLFRAVAIFESREN
jgi:aminopeptidase N